MKKLFFILLAIFTVSCDQENPIPNVDPIGTWEFYNSEKGQFEQITVTNYIERDYSFYSIKWGEYEWNDVQDDIDVGFPDPWQYGSSGSNVGCFLFNKSQTPNMPNCHLKILRDNTISFSVGQIYNHEDGYNYIRYSGQANRIK